MAVVYFLLCLICLAALYDIALYVAVRRCFPKADDNRGRKRDAILVLGCPAGKDGMPPPALRERIRKTVELYRQGVAGTVICAGAAVANGYTEADVIANALIVAGVPDSRILRDRLSLDTFENIVNAGKIMRDNALHTAVIVSSPWHVRKASVFASLLGIDHTVEASAMPREYRGIGAAAIYLHYYTQMMADRKRDRERARKAADAELPEA